MRNRFCGLVLGALVGFASAGCGGDDKKPANPKAPDNAPKLEPKTPGTTGPAAKPAGPAGTPD